MIAVSPELAAALAAPANQPLDLYELALDSGTLYWSTEDISWGGNAYTAMAVGRSPCVQNMTGDFNTVSVRVANVSTAAAQALLGETIEGRRLTIRKIDRTVAGDSVVLFSGVLQRISSIDDEEAVIEAIELLGSIDDQFGRPFQAACSIREFKGSICRYAGPETDCDRSWAQCSGYSNTESFFGMRFLEHQGVFQYVETQIKRFLFFFQRKKKTRKTASYTGVDDTPRGAAVPQIWGRTLFAAVPLYHEDQGGVVKGLSVFSGGPVDQIGYYRANEQLVPSVTEHQGQLGGLGNQTIDPRIANLYELSGLAYITYDVPSAVEEVDPAPLITGLVKGRLVRLYDSAGVFQGLAWSDNPALICHDFLVLELDHGGMGLSESDVNLTSLGATAAICDASIPDTTGDTKIFQPTGLPAGQTVGQEYRRYQPTGVIGQDPMTDGPYSVYTPGSDDDTQTPASVNVKRFTCSFAAAERIPKVDVLFDKLFPTFRGYRRYDKDGKIEILSEGANPFSTLTGAIAAGVSTVPVASTAGFAAGKFVILGPHTADAETIAIQSVSAGVLNLDAPTANAHASGDEALQVEMRLDDTRLIGKIQYPLSGREPSYNQVVVNYVDAPLGFEEVPLEVNDYPDQLARRKVESKEIDAAGVDSFFQAWRLGQTELAKSRDFAKWASIAGDISLSLLEVGDVVSLSSGEHGLSAVPFRVEQKADEEDHAVSLLLRIYSSGLYDDTAPRTTLNVPSVFAPILPGEVGLPSAPGPVTGLALVSVAQDPEDPMLVRIELSYAPPSPLGDFDGVEGQIEVPEEAEADPVNYAGPGQILAHGWSPSDGSNPSRMIVRMPYPQRAERWHIYALSRSEFVTAPLVHRGQPSPSPSLAVDVPQNPQGVEPPNVSGVTVTREFRVIPIRARTSNRTYDHLRVQWTLPTGAPNYKDLFQLEILLVEDGSGVEEKQAVLYVEHATDVPTFFLLNGLPSPETPTLYRVRIRAWNRFGRPNPSPVDSATITLGPVAAAPAIVSPSVTPKYILEGGVPKYGFSISWTLPTSHPDYDEAFDRVDVEARPIGEPDWILLAREGEGSTGVATSFWERPKSSQSWEFRFIPVNAAQIRNLGAIVTVSPVVVTALGTSAEVTNFVPSVTSGVNEAGVQLFGFLGSWSNPVDPNFFGVIVTAQWVGEGVERDLTGELTNGEISFRTSEWPRPETTRQIDLRARSISRDGSRSAGTAVRLTVTPGTGGLKLSRAALSEVGQGLQVSGSQLRVPNGGITDPMIGTVSVDKLIGNLIQGFAFQLISGSQQMDINGTQGFRQYNSGGLTEIRIFNGEISLRYNGTEIGRLNGFFGTGFLELKSLSGGGSAQLDASGGVGSIIARNTSGTLVSLLDSSGTIGQSGSGYLSIRNSSAFSRVELGVDSGNNGQVRFNGADYALRGAAASQKVVSGVAQFSGGQRTIFSGLSSVASAVATPVSGGTPTEYIGTNTPVGGNVTFYSSNSSSSGFFSYVIVGTV